MDCTFAYTFPIIASKKRFLRITFDYLHGIYFADYIKGEKVIESLSHKEIANLIALCYVKRWFYRKRNMLKFINEVIFNYTSNGKTFRLLNDVEILGFKTYLLLSKNANEIVKMKVFYMSNRVKCAVVLDSHGIYSLFVYGRDMSFIGQNEGNDLYDLLADAVRNEWFKNVWSLKERARGILDVFS